MLGEGLDLLHRLLDVEVFDTESASLLRPVDDCAGSVSVESHFWKKCHECSVFERR